MTQESAGAGPQARRRRITTTTASVAFIAMVFALGGLVQLLRPLATSAQDCGTAASFLVRGGANHFVDPTNPPKGVTKAGAKENNANPCQERAANRARPAAVLIVIGVAVSLVALFGEWIIRIRWTRADRRSTSVPPAPTPPGDQAPATVGSPSDA